MKTIKKYGVKGILSILLMLCMVLSIVPNMPSYADNPSVDKITINGQTLDSNKKYLVNGLASHTGNLDGINCTAMLDNGALTLFNYAGGGISTYTSRTAVDLTIYTIGTNIITEGNPSKYGIYHNSGEIKIGGVPDSKLTINVESGADGVYGISGYMTNSSRAYDITIWGFVDLIVNVENNSIPVPCKAYGVATYGNFSVLENASFKVKVAGRETWGVLVPSGNITINTDSEKEILIESLGAHSDSSLLTTSGSDQIYLEKAQKLHLKWANEGLEPNVQYVNFVKEPLFTDSDGYKNVIYRYREGTPRTLTVTGGFNEDGLASAKYLAGDEATVRAKAPEKNFKFKEWTGTEGLVFLEGTSKTRDEIKFTMPDKDVGLTAIYEQNLFEIQPKNNTSYAGNNIPFNWTISDYEGSLDDVDLQMKNGEVWKRVSVLPSSYKNPGFHTVSQSSSTAGEKTYRLNYRIYLDNFYSDEFTLKWLPAEVSNVDVTPNSSHPNVVEVEKGKTQQFTATVTGLGNFNDQVIWELKNEESPYTEITQDGLLIVSEDETANTIRVFARAKANLNKFCPVVVAIKEPPAFVTGISIYPSEVELSKGQSQQFTAEVTGVNAFDGSVNWTVSGNEHATISDSGYFIVNSYQNVGDRITITASSTVEPSISTTAKVTVVDQGVVTNLTISPKIVTVEKGASQDFIVDIMGTGSFNEGVFWSLRDMGGYGPSDSSISNTGLNATVRIGANEMKTKLKVKVTDSSTGLKSDFAIINVVGPPTISKVTVSPNPAKVQKGTTLQFNAIVEGTGLFNPDVVWSMYGGVAGTTIDASSGLLTVAAGETAKSLTVNAMSSTDNTKQAGVTVTITDTPVTRYVVTISNGTGSGDYEAGSTVAIAADPYFKDREFLKWVVTSGNITFADPNSNITTFEMPDGNIRLEACYKNPVMSSVKIDGTILDNDNRYISAGENPYPFAEFKPDTGTLILHDYYGNGIEYNSDYLGDLNIEINGINTITEYGTGQKIGIWNNSGGNINITADSDASLNINTTSTDGEAYGIAGNITGRNTGDINISGKANVAINVESKAATAIVVKGIHSADNLLISDSASLEVTAKGRSPNGIYTNKNMVFNTDNDITINSIGTNGGYALNSWGGINLSKVNSMTLKSRAVTIYPYVTYDESKFAVNNYLGDDGSNIKIYKYGTPYKVNVTKASPSGQYIKNNLVTITANDPDEYFEFKEWEGTEGLNFADGTSKTSAEIKFTMPARDLNLTATYQDTRFNLTVISGKGNGLYVPGSIVSVTANAPKANFKLKEWEGTEGLTFIGGTSKTKPEIQFNMPSKDLTLTAIYEDVLFIVQPQDKTGYVGENINFDWELADYSGSVYFVFRQIYEDGEWKHDSMALGDPYKEPGPHTSSVRSNTAGSKTYRLHYYLGTAIYSDPFTITWEEALIATGNIQGYASWGKVGDDSGIKVTAKEGDTTIAETHTGTDGGFELSLDAGIYDIVLSKSGYLERKISNVVVIQDLPTNLANNDNPISLLAGDINGDKSINANDLSVLLAAFNKTTSDAGYNEAADLNGDGSINANDLSMLLSNFNKTASDYPEWILP